MNNNMPYSLPLTSQVCSLELSRRLDKAFKEKGVKVETLFVWFNNSGIKGDAFWTLGLKAEIIDNGVILYPEMTIPALTSSEIGEMLPWVITVKENYNLQYYIASGATVEGKKVVTSWGVKYENEYMTYFHFEADSESESRGLMLEYLLTNELITL